MYNRLESHGSELIRGIIQYECISVKGLISLSYLSHLLFIHVRHFIPNTAPVMCIRDANMSVKIIPQEELTKTTSKDVPYAAFGARLMELRKNANMTRAEFGEICGVAPSTIVNYERGTRIPYADTAVKMADYFHISVHELLGVENPEIVMAQAEALDQMQSINGKKGADRLSAVLAEAGHLAGGDLSEEQLIEYTMELNKMAMQAQQRLREIHTNKRYQATVDAKAEATEKNITALDNAIRSLPTNS